MIAFLRASRLCASFGSSWCCLKSLRILSIHLRLGPSSMSLPSHLHRCYVLFNMCFVLFSLHGQITKGVSVRHHLTIIYCCSQCCLSRSLYIFLLVAVMSQPISDYPLHHTSPLYLSSIVLLAITALSFLSLRTPV